MSEETKIEDMDLIEDVAEVQLHDEALVEDVEVETEEAIVEDAEEIVAEDVTEELVAEEAIEEAATAEAPKTKAGIINAMYKEMSKMKKGDLMAAFDKMTAKDEEEEKDDEEDEEDMEETKGKVKESYDFQADLEALVSSDDLSEEFQGKAATIFEAAVKTKVAGEIDRLEAEYTQSLEEETASVKSELVEKVDGYLNYVVENWMEENRVAVETGLRAEIAESFMGALKGVFVEHYIDVPESKIDLVDDLADQVVELEEALTKETEANIRLNESIQTFQRSEIIAESTRDLAATEVEKLKELVEDVDFEDIDTFTKKIATLKESYFAKPIVTNQEEELQEETDQVKELSGSMALYSSAITKTLKK
mgnify:FL=1|jgi:hypothetical protein